MDGQIAMLEVQMLGFSIMRQMVFSARICSCIFSNCCCWSMVWVRFDYIIFDTYTDIYPILVAGRVPELTHLAQG